VPLLAYPGPAVAIMPKKLIDGVAAGKLPQTSVVGTGPYRLAEWVPDKHVHLERFAQYSPASAEASGYAGRRLACIEHIYFVPVPEVSSRVAGLESGDYDYAQNLPAETYKRLTATKGLKTVILKPYYEIVMHLNTQQGQLKEWKLRRAIQLGLNEEEDHARCGGGQGPLPARPQPLLQGAVLALHDRGQPLQRARRGQGQGTR
jgi:peptide/nickel transport system substrate-binding protein